MYCNQFSEHRYLLFLMIQWNINQFFVLFCAVLNRLLCCAVCCMHACLLASLLLLLLCCFYYTLCELVFAVGTTYIIIMFIINIFQQRTNEQPISAVLPIPPIICIMYSHTFQLLPPTNNSVSLLVVYSYVRMFSVFLKW